MTDLVRTINSCRKPEFCKRQIVTRLCLIKSATSKKIQLDKIPGKGCNMPRKLKKFNRNFRQTPFIFLHWRMVKNVVSIGMTKATVRCERRRIGIIDGNFTNLCFRQKIVGHQRTVLFIEYCHLKPISSSIYNASKKPPYLQNSRQ